MPCNCELSAMRFPYLHLHRWCIFGHPALVSRQVIRTAERLVLFSNREGILQPLIRIIVQSATPEWSGEVAKEGHNSSLITESLAFFCV